MKEYRLTDLPVPGYTGCVPRSREQFGNSYTEATRAALNEFEEQCKTRDIISNKLAHVIDCAHCTTPHEENSSKCCYSFENHHPNRQLPNPFVLKHCEISDALECPAKCPAVGHVAAQQKKEARARELNAQCPPRSRLYLPGYTGFLPHMRDRFGMQYQRAAVAQPQERVHQVTNVIPGHTGFIPKKKFTYAHTFGDTVKMLKGGKAVEESGTDTEPHTDISVDPVAGYQGFVPLYQFKGTRAFHPTSQECFAEYRALLRDMAEFRKLY